MVCVVAVLAAKFITPVVASILKPVVAVNTPPAGLKVGLSEPDKQLDVAGYDKLTVQPAGSVAGKPDTAPI